MVMEWIVGAIAIAFIVLVVFSVIALQNLSKTLKKADKTLSEVHRVLNALSGPGEEALYQANKLIVDVKRKSEALDVLFHPLHALKKETSGFQHGCEKVSEIAGYITEGIRIFKIIKNELK